MGRALNILRRLAVVRLIVMAAVMIAALIGVQLLHFAVFAKHLPLALDTTLTLIASFALLGVYVLLVRLFERRPANELALKPGVRWAGLGVVLGFGLFVALYAVLTAMGVAAWA